MEVTSEEREWAIAIKHAAIADDDIIDDVLTDFEYLQHAFVAKDKVGKAVKRIKQLQAFKKRYGIKLDGSVEEAERDLKALNLQFPGLMVSLGTRDNGSHVTSVDISKILARRLKTEEAHAIFLRFFFYMLQACNPTIQAIRAGSYCLSKSESVGFRNFSFESEDRQAELYSHAYPFRFQQMVMIQAPFIARMIFQVIVIFMTSKMRKRFDMTAEGETYLKEHGFPESVLPTFWGGVLEPGSMTDVMLLKLEERYRNMKTFELETQNNR